MKSVKRRIKMVRIKKHGKYIVTPLLILIILIFIPHYAYAAPAGPDVISIRNETASSASATLINTTGGSITTMVLNITTQNLKWKAFVGNVTGSLALEDSAGYSIFDWTLNSVVGEVYATRSADTVSWVDVSCGNMTHITNEETALNHTSNPDDNISATFNAKNHDSFYVGVTEITENSCYSIYTNVNNKSQSNVFEEIILYDGTNPTNGDIIYATKLEQDALGYDNNPYDFQMILPEVGLSSWKSSTAYYFYVELT